MAIFNVSIQQIIADICGSAIHPFDGNWALGNVKVVAHKIAGISWRFPVKLLCNIAPEFIGLIDGLVIELLVLVEGRNIRVTSEFLIRLVDILFGWHFVRLTKISSHHNKTLILFFCDERKNQYKFSKSIFHFIHKKGKKCEFFYNFSFFFCPVEINF